MVQFALCPDRQAALLPGFNHGQLFISDLFIVSHGTNLHPAHHNSQDALAGGLHCNFILAFMNYFCHF